MTHGTSLRRQRWAAKRAVAHAQACTQARATGSPEPRPAEVDIGQPRRAPRNGSPALTGTLELDGQPAFALSAIAEAPRPRKEGPRVWCAVGFKPDEVRGPHTHRECRRIAYRWWLEGRLGFLERRAGDGKDVYTLQPHFAGRSILRGRLRKAM